MKWLEEMKNKQRWVTLSLLLLITTISVALQFWYACRVTLLVVTRADNYSTSTRPLLATVEGSNSNVPFHHFKATTSPSSSISTSFSTSLSAMTIDIVSIGSLSRPDYLQAQRETMGQYARHFIGVTEADDHSEPNCSLTREDAQQIAEHCRLDRPRRRDPSQLEQPYSSLYLRREDYFGWDGTLSKKSNPGGWLCAQKRANDGLQIMLQKIRETTLPEYLLLIDDDTFIDIPQLAYYLQTIYPDSTKPLVIAGCLMRFKEGFTIPFGGFGSFLSKGALTRLLTPITCSNHTNATTAASDEEDFMQNACNRLQQNLFGEQQYFQEHMSLADLIHSYVSANRFADHASWTNESSFCVHSDWIWGFFFNYYNVGEAQNHPKYPQSHNRMTSYRMSEYFVKVWGGPDKAQRKEMEGQCQYTKPCPPEAHMCHYVTAERIRQEGQRVFSEPKWVIPPKDLQQPIPIFLYPVLNHTMEDELDPYIYDGIQASSQLTLTQDYKEAPIWIVDVRRAGLSSKTFCNRFVQLVRDANGQKRVVIFVYWDDDPLDSFWSCYRATRLLDSTTVFRYKRSIVQGRQWNDTLQFVEPGSIISFGNWRDHSGGPVRHIGYGVRSDVVEGIESVLNGASLWEIERPVDVSHFWPLPGQGDKEIHRGKASQLRDAVSQVIDDRLSPTRAVFVGVSGLANESVYNTTQSAYLRQLLQNKIVVVSQLDNVEDDHRLMEALVSGAMVMTDPMLTLPSELQDNVSIVVYRNLDELVTKALYYLDHEDERIAIARAGYDVAMNHHRSWHLVERMVSEVRSVSPKVKPS